MSVKEKPRDILYYIVFVLFKKKKLIAVIFFFTLFSFVFGTFLITPEWKATTRIIVLPNPRQQTMLFKDLAAPPPAIKDTSVYDVVEMLTSNEFGVKIVEQFELDERLRQKNENPQTLRDKIKLLMVKVVMSPMTLATRLGLLPEGEPNYAAKALEDLIEDMEDFEVTEGTSTLELSIWAGSPELATGIANTLATMAAEKTKNFEQNEADETYQFLDAHLKSVEESLEEAEDDLVRFKEQNKIVDLGKEKTLKLQRLEVIRARVDETKTNLLAVGAKLQHLRKQLSSQPQKITTSEVIGTNTGHMKLKESLNKAEIQLATLKQTLRPEHPDIRALEAQIQETTIKLQQEKERTLQNETETTNPIHQEISKQIIEFEALLSELSSKYDSLQRMLVETSRDLDSLAHNEMTLERMRRSVSSLKDRFVKLRDKLLELEVQRFTTFSEYDIKISDSAYIPKGVEPDWPIWPLNLIVGVLFGMILSIGTAFFGEYWSDALDIHEDVEKEIGLKILGTVASFTRKNKTILKQLRC